MLDKEIRVRLGCVVQSLVSGVGKALWVRPFWDSKKPRTPRAWRCRDWTFSATSLQNVRLLHEVWLPQMPCMDCNAFGSSAALASILPQLLERVRANLEPRPRSTSSREPWSSKTKARSDLGTRWSGCGMTTEAPMRLKHCRNTNNKETQHD